MLDPLIEHFQKTENKSLIARVYGIFTIKTNLFASLDVMIMQNTCLLKNKRNEKIIFDIKGSTTNRLTILSGSDYKFWKKSLSCKRVLKDMNFLEISSEKYEPLVKFDKKQKDHLEELIQLDSQFLRDQKIMDYSLLLVIELQPINEEEYSLDSKEIIVNDIVEEMLIEKQIKTATFN